MVVQRVAAATRLRSAYALAAAETGRNFAMSRMYFSIRTASCTKPFCDSTDTEMMDRYDMKLELELRLNYGITSMKSLASPSLRLS